MTWKPDASVRPHPFGEQGIRSSLEEVARRASGLLSSPEDLAKIRTWAIEKLDEARKQGIRVNTPRARAEVLLHAVQKKLWVPDPIGVEYIPGAHLLACDVHDGKEVCVKGDDCDGLVTLLAACLLAVGVYTMIAGHAYNNDELISHVLVKVYVDGKWQYADPSPLMPSERHMPFGTCAPFTRERCYALPDVKVVCDGVACRKNIDPVQAGFVSKGNFVGVNGLPVEEMPPTASPFGWLGVPTSSTLAVQEQPEHKLSSIEKIMIASVLISTAGLLTTWYKLFVQQNADD
jgi:hypothetical protein